MKHLNISTFKAENCLKNPFLLSMVYCRQVILWSLELISLSIAEWYNLNIPDRGVKLTILLYICVCQMYYCYVFHSAAILFLWLNNITWIFLTVVLNWQFYYIYVCLMYYCYVFHSAAILFLWLNNITWIFLTVVLNWQFYYIYVCLMYYCYVFHSASILFLWLNDITWIFLTVVLNRQFY